MTNKSPLKSLALATILAAGTLTSLRSIEIPLESFGKGTKIAYVNMHKIFEAFPETEKARVELNRTIEEKKSEISARKEEIAKLKAEVDFIRKQNQSVEPSTASKINLQQKQQEEQRIQAQDETRVSTDTQPSGITSLTLPEGSPMGFLFSPPKESTAPRSLEAEIQEETAQRPVKLSTSGPQILPGVPSLRPQLAEKEAELTRKQADLEAFVGAAEEEVKNLEEGKTMTLLARIYKGLEEIANKDGYTIIVDKDSILYGENTVDITQSVIWRLQGLKTKGS